MLLGLVSVTGMPYAVLMPIFADRILHGGGQEFAALIRSHDLGAVRLGILMGATVSGGAAGRAHASHAVGSQRAGNVGDGVLRWFWAEPDLFASSKVFWLSVFLLMPVGYFIMLQMACSNTLIQVMVPDAAARARDGSVFDDVYGHGAAGSVARRRAG